MAARRHAAGTGTGARAGTGTGTGTGTDTAELEHHARVRTLSRTAAFTDASVAIALTLLILPLADAARSIGTRTVGNLLGDQRAELVGFFISFAVIIRLWTVHRRSWEGLDDYDEVIMGLNFAWLLTVVFVPFPTALLTSTDQLSREGVLVYLGTLLASGATSSAMGGHILRTPALRLHYLDRSTLRVRQWAGYISLAVIVLAMGAALITPVAGLFTLLLLVLARVPLRVGAVRRRIAR
jgi:uncharacterized membrane protein